MTPLPAIPYLRLRCTLRAEAPARLPPFHGSLLRGAFGHALRRLACAAGPGQECAACRLRRACPYPRLFETFLEQDVSPPPFLRGIKTAPRPYVFEPTGGESFAPGDPLRFDLLLFGQAVALQAYALVAVERMAEAGLGPGRAPFTLERVEAPADGGFETVYAAGRGAAREPAPRLLPAGGPAGPRATLHLLTPTNVQTGGRPAEPTVRNFAFAMLRRTLEIAAVHQPGAAVDWDLELWLDRTREVRITRADVRWVEARRWSNRQGRATPLAGFVGRLELEGDLAPLAPLLAAAEVLHVGKGATFGLGRVALEERK